MTYAPPTNIYFVRAVGQPGPWKIGCASDPVLRLRQMQTWCPIKLEVAASVAGTMYDEKRMHRLLAGHRLHGEWFADCDEIRSILAEIAATLRLPSRCCAPIRPQSYYLQHHLERMEYRQMSASYGEGRFPTAHNSQNIFSALAAQKSRRSAS